MPPSAHRPYSIKIFLPHGDPDGLRVIGKSNWTGTGVVFNRTAYQDAANRPEITKTGVYILVGPSEDSSLPTVYIGEGDPIKPRLDSHYANKDFWTWAVFFTAADGSLNKAHVKHLECRLVELAKAAKQANLDNVQTPQPPTLAEAELADTESFLADMLGIFPLLGLSVFEAKTATARGKTILFLKGAGVEAQGFEASQGFVVRKGSKAKRQAYPSANGATTHLRNDLIKQEVLTIQDDIYIFTQDYVFNSPSLAASVILGRNANGRIEWKDLNGETLKCIQTKASNTAATMEH
jgi:hypothetical protein